MPPDRERAPQAGGKRKNTKPGELREPISQKAEPTHSRKLYRASTGLAAFTHRMTQASLCFDEVQAEMRADYARLRADNAALTARLEVATKKEKRTRSAAQKYFDLAGDAGVSDAVLFAVEDGPIYGVMAEVSGEEAEESDEEAVFGVEKGNAEEVEEQQQHVPP